jgi:PAS domain S-box-containing protein
MFGTFVAAPLHFTIEFVGFVVCAGAMFLVPARRNLIANITGARTASLGFAALAAASVLHGARFIASENDPSLMILYGFGAGWILAGVVGGGSPRPRLSRLGSAAILFGASVALSTRSQSAVDVGDTDAGFWIAHGVRLASYTAIVWWLWEGVRASVRTRFVATYAALLVVVVLALSTTLSGVISADVEREELDRVSTQLRSAAASINDRETALTRYVRSIAAAEAVRTSFVTTSALESLATTLAKGAVVPLDVVVFTSPQGQLLGHAGEGPVLGAERRPQSEALQRSDLLSMLGSPIVTESVIESGREAAAGLDRIDNDTLAILAAADVPDPDVSGNSAGIVIGVEYLDQLLVDEISADFRPAHATLFLDGRPVASKLPRTSLEGDRMPSPARGTPTELKQALGGKPYFTAFLPLDAEAGDPYLSLSSPGEIIATTRRDVIRGLFLVALGVAVVALGLAWLSGRRITRPIQELTATAMAVREGDLSARAAVAGEDEVGQLGQTFNQMTASLITTTRAEQALRMRIETIIQSMADGLVAVDANKRILAFNVEAELLTGTAAGDAMGRPVEDVLVVRDGHGRRVGLPILDLEEGAVSGVYMSRRHGTPVPVAVTSAVLRGEGDEPAGGVAVIRDMTREHEIERMKSDFLSNISHELRTPLTPIKGYADLLAGKDIPREQTRTFARGIADSTKRLERIVALLIDFSAMEAGKLAPRSGAVDMASLVRALASEWGDRAQRHRVVADVEEVPAVTGDERLLRRSLEEVLDNAVKFSPQGGTIRLQVRGVNTNGADRASAAVQVAVSDEGIGIPTEELPMIFTGFHQLDASETRAYGGLGLGLAFVQGIIAAHQGDIVVESEPDHGTRLTITIPASPRALNGSR